MESDETLSELIDILPNFIYFNTIELLEDEAR